MEKMKRHEWALLALALAGGKSLSPVQLQKSVFLFGAELGADGLSESFYEFIPDNYGPFCGELYDDVRHLVAEGLATVSVAPGASYCQYAASDAGIVQLPTISGKLPPAIYERARRIVEWTRAQSFRGLVSAVYQKYPEYKVNSIFKE